ncbi:DNA polymerase III subunit epsilon [Frondihabitans sp. PAMC 28766]|uniref:exonuclease domain-containing protein n=1 Tax=Frondihabitans sp. PAMC 28766 TaxID=1795630 RepID=UPI00078D4FC3|nr:exonuclease domain-containing protein [Frondihabitans sp. PAMC 28766]AMM20253.1 DNA polymerase III subunit epsilon [Frondihabitans sp. PAMC 28766]
MSLDYVAIDFETANSSSASACSVGLVKVVGGRVVDKTGWLIKPPFGHDEFSEWNTRIHGIVRDDVVDALEWHEQMADLLDFVGDEILVAHNAGFDMGVIRGACAATGIETPESRYFCSLQVARKTYTLDSYRLPMAAMAAGFDEFNHHEALADAEACAAIIAHSAKRHGADTVDELAAATGVRVNRLAPAVRFV